METKQVPNGWKCVSIVKASVVNWNGYAVESRCSKWAKQHYIYWSEETPLETYGLLSKSSQPNKLWNTTDVFLCGQQCIKEEIFLAL